MTTDKQKLAEGIYRQLQMHNAYSFRPVRIDGIYCYIYVSVEFAQTTDINVQQTTDINVQQN